MTRSALAEAGVDTPSADRRAAGRPHRPGSEPQPPGGDWMVVALGGLWLLVLALWARGVLRSVASVLYLLAVAAVAVYVARAVQESSQGDDGWRTGRKALLLGLLVAVPVVFDPVSSEVFNSVRYAVVVVAAIALAGLWAVDAVRHRRLPWWRNALCWPVLALVGWTALTTATSVNPRFSALGAYGSYDGLYTTIALAVVVFVTADTLRLSDLKAALGVLYLGGGGLVVLYGLIQLHDVATSGRNWDWVPWQGGEGLSAISANLGNPNHVGQFLAMVFPVGLVLLVLARARWLRALVFVTGAAMVVVLVHTASRGAWLAVLAATLSVGVLLGHQARRRPGPFVAVSAAYVAVAIVAGLTLSSSGNLQTKLDVDELSTTEATSANQRIELWRAAVAMANDRPVVGMGPDAFGPRFYAYQSAEFTERYGTRGFANGAHNLLFNQLANQGYPGLAILVALLVAAGLLGVATWRSLGHVERHGGERLRPDDDARLRQWAGEGRLALAGIGAGLVAYVVAASFNTQKIALSFLFWALLGLLCVAARAVGARVVLPWPSNRGGQEAGAAGPPSLHQPPPTRRDRQQPRRGALSVTEQFFVYGIAAIVVVALIGVGSHAAAPWQADRAYGEGRRLLASDARSQPDAASRGFRALDEARALNPWEPRYYQGHALLAVRQAARLPAGSPRQRELLARADEAYRHVVRVEPGGPRFLLAYGNALLHLYRAQPTLDQAREGALEALQRAHRLSPRDRDIAASLRAAEQS